MEISSSGTHRWDGEQKKGAGKKRAAEESESSDDVPLGEVAKPKGSAKKAR
jgi:hypothetical protein